MRATSMSSRASNQIAPDLAIPLPLEHLRVPFERGEGLMEVEALLGALHLHLGLDAQAPVSSLALQRPGEGGGRGEGIAAADAVVLAHDSADREVDVVEALEAAVVHHR